MRTCNLRGLLSLSSLGLAIALVACGCASPPEEEDLAAAEGAATAGETASFRVDDDGYIHVPGVGEGADVTLGVAGAPLGPLLRDERAEQLSVGRIMVAEVDGEPLELSVRSVEGGRLRLQADMFRHDPGKLADRVRMLQLSLGAIVLRLEAKPRERPWCLNPVGRCVEERACQDAIEMLVRATTCATIVDRAGNALELPSSVARGQLGCDQPADLTTFADLASASCKHANGATMRHAGCSERLGRLQDPMESDACASRGPDPWCYDGHAGAAWSACCEESGGKGNCHGQGFRNARSDQR